MNPLSIIALAVIATMFGSAWHDQPARNPEKESPAENPGMLPTAAIRNAVTAAFQAGAPATETAHYRQVISRT